MVLNLRWSVTAYTSNFSKLTKNHFHARDLTLCWTFAFRTCFLRVFTAFNRDASSLTLSLNKSAAWHVWQNKIYNWNIWKYKIKYIARIHTDRQTDSGTFKYSLPLIYSLWICSGMGDSGCCKSKVSFIHKQVSLAPTGCWKFLNSGFFEHFRQFWLGFTMVVIYEKIY